jgi:purine nucleosidase
VTEAAEFNIYSDAAAAQAVFASGVPVTVVSAERLAALEPDVAGILDQYGAFSRARWGDHSGPLQDPNVLARIAEPDPYSG